MTHRATHTLNKGVGRKVSLREEKDVGKHFYLIGDVVPDDHPSLEHWKNRGYVVEETGEFTDVVDKPEDNIPVALTLDSEIKTQGQGLEFLRADSVGHLINAGILIIGDLDGMTVEELTDIPTIGDSTAEKLIALFDDINGSA